MKGKRPVMPDYTGSSSLQPSTPSNNQVQNSKQQSNTNYNSNKSTENMSNKNLPNTNQKVKKDYKIDPAVIPRPNFNEEVYKNDQRLPIYNTNETATPPPLSNTYFIVNETQNSSPRLVRSSLNKIPCDQGKLNASCLNFGKNIITFLF